MREEANRTRGMRAGVLVAIVASFLGGSVLSDRLERLRAAESERATYAARRLTSPYLEAPGEANADPELVRARDAIVAEIEQARAADPSLRVSVYARDLDRGPWIGVDEREPYVPASLSKVAVLIHTLHRAESEPDLLDRSCVFDSTAMHGADSMDRAPAELRMVHGASYTYRDLLHRMIAYSDNFATQMLLEGVEPASLNGMLRDLSAGESFEAGYYHVDARSMGTLFRVLYNATFLSRSHSELALELLTSSFFQDGLRKYLPDDVLVASKFGYFPSAPGEGAQFHECGITYAPDGAYVLCVMTGSEQASYGRLAEQVARVARIVWLEKGVGQ